MADAATGSGAGRPPHFEPTDAEVREYAKRLGLDDQGTDSSELLDIAREGLRAAPRGPATPQRGLAELGELAELDDETWRQCLQAFVDSRRAHGHELFESPLAASGVLTVCEADVEPVRAALLGGRLEELGQHLARLLAACLGEGAEPGESFRLSLARRFRGYVLLKASGGSVTLGSGQGRGSLAAESAVPQRAGEAPPPRPSAAAAGAAYRLFEEQRLVETSLAGTPEDVARQMIGEEWQQLDAAAREWWQERARDLSLPEPAAPAAPAPASGPAEAEPEGGPLPGRGAGAAPSVGSPAAAPAPAPKRGRKRRSGDAADAPREGACKSEVATGAPSSLPAAAVRPAAAVKQEDGAWLRVDTPATRAKAAAESDEEGEDGEEAAGLPQRQASFRESSAVAAGAPHPDWLTEPAAVADISLPALDGGEVIRIPPQVASGGRLSSPQLESVAYAARRFRSKLPGGASAGYFLGDGTGCGKGRVIAALVWHLWNSGARRHVWLSASADLLEDARRDFQDLGAKLPVCALSSLGYGPIGPGRGLDENGDGVLFAGYSLLVAARNAGSAPQSPDNCRLQQIIQWLRGGPGGACGVIALDEAHRVKNVGDVDAREDSSASARGTGGSRAGACALELQRLCPGCPVLYASATGATEIKHLAYLERLGLWGPGRPHSSFEELRGAVESGGLAAMELLAMTMRAEGMLSCRSLSFKGASFRLVEVPLDGPLLNGYVAACTFWQQAFQLLQGLMKAKKHEMKKKRLKVSSTMQDSALTMRHFWGCQQQFFRQMLVCAKVPQVASLAESARLRGEAVVIAMWSTGEAVTSARLDREGAENFEGFASAPHEVALRLLNKVIDPTISDVVSTGGATRETAKAEADLARLRQALAGLQLPPNPMDALIAKLGGPREVAELSGRTQRPIIGAGGKVHFEDRGDGANLEEQKAFQGGAKRVAIITEAASAGISLHADLRLPSEAQRPRYMIAIELPWEADKAIQQLGRVHRSNQRVPPKFAVVVTDLGGEVRFVSAVARRLRILGAMMRGDRNSAHGAVQSIAPFDVQNRYGRRALGRFFELLRSHAQPEVDFSFMASSGQAGRGRRGRQWTSWDKFCNDAHQALERVGLRLDSEDRFEESLDPSRSLNVFLNRLLMMEPHMQNALFDAVAELYAHMVGLDHADGSLDVGLESIERRGRQRASVSVDHRETLFKDPETGAETIYVRLRVDQGLSWRAAEQLLERYGDGEPEGFYWHGGGGGAAGRGIVLALRRPRHSVGLARSGDDDEDDPLLDLLRPDGVAQGGQQLRPVRSGALDRQPFARVARSEWARAERAWGAQHSAAGRQRWAEEHVLSGSILNTWASVGSAVGVGLSRHGAKKLPLVRASLADGGAIVGVRVRPEQLEEVRYALSALFEQSAERRAAAAAGQAPAPPGGSCGSGAGAARAGRGAAKRERVEPEVKAEPAVKAEPLCMEDLRDRLEAYLREQPDRTASWRGWAGAHALLTAEGLVAGGTPGMHAAQEAFADLERNGKLDIDMAAGTVHLREKQKGAGWYVPPPKKPKTSGRGRGRGRGRAAARG